MSLLPSNSSYKDQLFAELLDKRSACNYSDVTTDPLKCDSSILPHIAVSKGANIEGMLEHEVRSYLSTFTKKALGTVGAVEDAVNVCFQDAKITEWFNDENLTPGYFSVDMTIKADPSIVYSDRLFSISNRLIKKAKNVRSHFKDFRIHLPMITAQVNVSSSNDLLKVHPFMSINELIVADHVALKTGYFHQASMKSGFSEIIESQDINLQGGYRCQVEV